MTTAYHFETLGYLQHRINLHWQVFNEIRHNLLAPELLIKYSRMNRRQIIQEILAAKLASKAVAKGAIAATNRLCARNPFLCKVATHVFVAGLFLVTTFSLGLFLYNGDVTNTLSVLKMRRPAMMRMNPAVFGPKSQSKEESDATSQALLSPGETAREKFGLSHDISDFSRGIDLRTIDRVQTIGTDYSLILPSSLSPVTEGGQVAAQVLDHSVSSFFKQESVRNTAFGRAAIAVEEKMKAEVALGGDEPDSTQHNIKFQMKASQTKASMEYRGITNADLSYSVAARSTDLEIFEPLSLDSKLVYSHSNRPDEKRDMISLRLNW